MRLRACLDRIIRLLGALNVRLEPHHISGELNQLADHLSRVVYHNRFALCTRWLSQHAGRFAFDLTGDSLRSYAPLFPVVPDYRRRTLDMLPRGLRSIAVPQWGHLLPLL